MFEIALYFARFGLFIFSLGLAVLMLRMLILETRFIKRSFIFMVIVGSLAYSLYFFVQLFLKDNNSSVSIQELIFVNFSSLLAFAGLFFNLLTRVYQIKIAKDRFNQVVKYGNS